MMCIIWGFIKCNEISCLKSVLQMWKPTTWGSSFLKPWFQLSQCWKKNTYLVKVLFFWYIFVEIKKIKRTVAEWIKIWTGNGQRLYVKKLHKRWASITTPHINIIQIVQLGKTKFPPQKNKKTCHFIWRNNMRVRWLKLFFIPCKRVSHTVLHMSRTINAFHWTLVLSKNFSHRNLETTSSIWLWQ